MKVIDVAEILEHWHAGRRMVELSTSLGVDPKTVRKYVAPAREAGLVPGGAPLSRAQWATLAAEWFPETADRSSLQSTWSEIEGHRDQVKTWLDGGVTIATIHQRLRDNLGLSASESSLRRWIHANLAEEASRNAVVVLRDTPPPGAEAQVDYGLLGRWFDPSTQRWRRVWGFIMVLAFSRLMFVRPVLKMDQRSWVGGPRLCLRVLRPRPATATAAPSPRRRVWSATSPAAMPIAAGRPGSRPGPGRPS